MTGIKGNSPQTSIQIYVTPDGTNMAPLSASNPLPVTGSISATNPSVGQSGAADPGYGTVVGFISGGLVAEVSAAAPLPVSATIGESVLNVQGTVASAAVLSNFPVNPTTGYRSVLVQVTNAGSTCTLVAEQSNDGTTWTGMQTIADTAIEASTPMTTTGQYVFNITALQFRVRCSVYGSGNPAVNAEFRQAVGVPLDIPYLAQINTTLGSGVTVSQGTAASLNATVSIASAQTLATVTTVGTVTTITNDVPVVPSTDNFASGTSGAVTGTASTQVIALVGGKRIYVNNFSLSNSSATTITVNFQDGNGGTTLWTCIVPAGGGSNLSGTSPFFRTTSGNGLYMQSSGSATTVYANASGFSGN